jgi:predicted dehydrogenase
MTTRFNPGIQAVRRAVLSGALGQVLLVSDRVAFTLAPGDLAEWYFDVKRSGGGVVVTNGVHSLDRVAWILGEALVLRSAQLSSQVLTSCEDPALLELSAGGVPVHIIELWGPGPVPPSELTVIGSHGTCWTDAEGNWRLSSLGASTSGDRPSGYSELAAQWLSFRALVLEGRSDGTLPQVDELLASMELLAQVLDR